MNTESENMETTEDAAPTLVQKWMKWGILFSIIGIAVSIYSINHHLQLKASGSTNAFCNINQTFNCDDVASSKYSEILGIPLGVYGLGYFLAMLLLGLITLGNKVQRAAHLQAYGLLVSIGFLTSIALASISAFDLGAFCLTCIGIYVVTIAQLIAFIVYRKSYPKINLKELFTGASTALVIVAVVVAGFSMLSSQSKQNPSQGPELNSENTQKPLELLSKEIHNIPINMSAYSGLGEDYRAGSDSAKVKVIEFADFQCPACRQMFQSLKKLKDEYGDQILVVFKNYPLDQKCNPGIKGKFHETACTSAILARCSGAYGKFWQFHDLAYTEQSSASIEQSKLWAKQIGLTDDQINACLADKSIVEKIRDDIQIANDNGLTGTPTVFINGRKLLGNHSYFEIKLEIEKILAGN
ncbi:MAG: vitamin K epoxide reductase family protein [Bdellovibrionota bacterium]